MIGNQLKESAELRTLRQTSAHVDTLSFLAPDETVTLSITTHRVCSTAIERLWDDTSLTIDCITALSDWVWQRLMKSVMLGHGPPTPREKIVSIRELISVRLGHLLLPNNIRLPVRRDHYTRWIEQSVLEPFRPANSNLIQNTLVTAVESISALDENQEAYGHLFLKQLPEANRGVVIAKNIEFARRCGFVTRQIFRFEPDIELLNSELFSAAKDVLATNKEKCLQDISGKKVIVDLDIKDRNIVIKCADSKAIPSDVKIPDLALLSPIGTDRITALREIIQRLGPTAKDYRYLLRVIKSSMLTDADISMVFDEIANGIVSIQASLIGKVNSGSGFSVMDVIPESVSYFEKFAGPLPTTRDPEAYIREVLIPYRREASEPRPSRRT